MNPELRAEKEAEIRALCEAEQIDEATTRAFELYGEEIGAYLAATLRNEAVAGDVFSQWCEDLWLGLPAFKWTSSLRTWSYTLARNAGHRHRRSPKNRPQNNMPLELNSRVSKLVQGVRDSTALYLKTQVKDRMRKLRDALDEEDQTLLILRVDRKLDWTEVARVFLEEDADDAAVKKKAAALRKRFERLKLKLRELAEKEGILKPRE
jgi:RNA polymerase sigma-70 factor (ECF subfamily)